MLEQTYELALKAEDGSDLPADEVVKSLAVFPVEVMEQKAGVIALRAARAGRFDVLLQWLPSLPAATRRGEILALSFWSEPEAWLSRHQRKELSRLYPHWIEDLLARDASNLCAWERWQTTASRLRSHRENYRIHHYLLAWVARHVEKRIHAPAAYFAQSHPAHPEITLGQAWSWLWVRIPMVPCRAHHWKFLVPYTDPNFKMRLNDGYLSLGTALLWSLSDAPQINDTRSSWTALSTASFIQVLQVVEELDDDDLEIVSTFDDDDDEEEEEGANE